MSKRVDDEIMNEEETTTETDRHWSQVTQRHYDPDGTEELTTVIVYAIAEARGVSPMELKSPPLYEVVDVPAIENTFFGPDVAGDSRRGIGTVEFQYTNSLVQVESDGWVHVYESTGPDDSGLD